LSYDKEQNQDNCNYQDKYHYPGNNIHNAHKHQNKNYSKNYHQQAQDFHNFLCTSNYIRFGLIEKIFKIEKSISIDEEKEW